MKKHIIRLLEHLLFLLDPVELKSVKFNGCCISQNFSGHLSKEKWMLVKHTINVYLKAGDNPDDVLKAAGMMIVTEAK